MLPPKKLQDFLWPDFRKLSADLEGRRFARKGELVLRAARGLHHGDPDLPQRRQHPRVRAQVGLEPGRALLPPRYLQIWSHGR